MSSNPASSLLFACCFGLALAGGSESAHAAEIFNTGVDASGQPLSIGSSDPHWTVFVDDDDNRPAPAVVSAVFVEFPTRPDSAWIWVSVNAAATSTPYTFRTTFVLSPEQAMAPLLIGSWSVDNVGRIELNGAAPIGSGALDLSVSLASNYQTFHDFAITGGFVAGVNTLDFISTDFGGVAGLNVAGLSISTVPEPLPSVLMLLGFTVIAWRVLRSDRASPACACGCGRSSDGNSARV